MPASTSTLPEPSIDPATTCVPLPLFTRSTAPSAPPPIEPLKVLVAPVRLMVNTDAAAVLLLIMLPPLPCV